MADGGDTQLAEVRNYDSLAHLTDDEQRNLLAQQEQETREAFR